MTIFQLPLAGGDKNIRAVVANITNVSQTSQLLKHQVSDDVNGKGLESKAEDSCGIVNIDSIVRRPICGNGVCEIQETPGIGGGHECPEDCPFKFSQCGIPSESQGLAISGDGAACAGNGACHPAGTRPHCSCYFGFDSELCDKCAPGFDFFEGSCVRRQFPLLAVLPEEMEIEGEMT